MNHRRFFLTCLLSDGGYMSCFVTLPYYMVVVRRLDMLSNVNINRHAFGEVLSLITGNED